jgi:predicted DNA-binding transcriptional regulator AlpA
MSDVLDGDGRVTQLEAAKLLGGVSQMCLWRWRNDPAMNFPKPITINHRHYYRRAEILNWRPPAKPKYGRSGLANAG